MSLVRFQQGEDRILTVAVLGSGASTVDLSSATAIRAQLTTPDQTLLEKFSFISQSGYGSLEVDSVESHKVNIFVKRYSSKNYPVGVVNVNLLVQFPDAAQPDGYRHEEYNFANIARVDEGNMVDENLP